MTMSVLDASVAVSALRASDANHARAVSHLAPLLQGVDSIVVPTLFDVEVVATLIRAGYAASDARRAADLFVSRARMVTLGPRAARAASSTASRTGLRTGDAVYVSVAERERRLQGGPARRRVARRGRDAKRAGTLE
jgi:predicted nucleic acid-binding protein